MAKQFTNSLINESSPYLLQHAHNPVNWYPWCDEALEKAGTENKIILVSIGYSACHWCHVMEKESFENEEVANLMNEHFINIKIDREERPDLDHIYMDAVQLMTGSGGWPLNVFLTPEAKPFYGGTYFPPVKAYNRSSWTDVLSGILTAWRTRETEIRAQAENLTAHLIESGDAVLKINAGINTNGEDLLTEQNTLSLFENVMRSADTNWGGFGKAPKFPQFFVIQFLLQYHFFTGNAAALNQARLSLDKMLEGGIYDQVGGGMARYSTDDHWLAPHFEKMLYDNALLINLLSDIYLITKDPKYELAIRKTIAFAQRELMNPSGGFCSAIDADSEGEEGKYYVWDKKEIDELLGEGSPLFCSYFDVTESGNWSHQAGTPKKNILRILKVAPLFAAENNIPFDEFEKRIRESLEKLFKTRKRRIRPQTDDKVLLNWNALMVTALCKAAAALSDRDYRSLAEKTFDFLLNSFVKDKNTSALYHCYKNTQAKYPAFLDDYACMIQCGIQLHELTANTVYLTWAKRFTSKVIEDFTDEETGLFFFTGSYQKDVIIRKKELYDGATPSGNSLMAENLFCLADIFDSSEWYNRAFKMTGLLKTAVLRYPSSFGIWTSVVLKQHFGLNEIVVIGPDYEQIQMRLLKQYCPDRVLQCGLFPIVEYPLMAGKYTGDQTLIYQCRKQACLPPVASPDELLYGVRISNLKKR